MKKKRRIWILAAVLAVAAVQGTVFAEDQESGSTAEAVTETTTEADKLLKTEVLMEAGAAQDQKDWEETNHADAEAHKKGGRRADLIGCKQRKHQHYKRRSDRGGYKQ